MVFVPKHRVQVRYSWSSIIGLPHRTHDGKAYLFELFLSSLKGARALRVHSLVLCGLALPMQGNVFQTRDYSFPLIKTLLLDLSGPNIRSLRFEGPSN